MLRLRLNRRRFRYRLATLLLLITLAGVILPIETNRRRRAWAIDEIRQLGGKVSTRHLLPRWARQRFWLPAVVEVADAELLLILQPDGSLTPANHAANRTVDPIPVGRIRVLVIAAGLPPQRFKLRVIPTSATPHTLTSRVAADVRAAGFGSAWEEDPTEDENGKVI